MVLNMVTLHARITLIQIHSGCRHSNVCCYLLHDTMTF